VFDNGTPSMSATQSFAVVVTESNAAPVLTVPGSRTVTELSTLTLTNTATDSDLPAQMLTFELVSAPGGVNLNPVSGVLTWTPTEAQGPSTNTITLRVFDDGSPSLSATQSFVVTVTESNSAPSLTVPANQTLFELTTLTVTNTASDSDLPAQTLTFALLSAPGGVNLDSVSGVLTWTPTEAQGPSTNTIRLRVFDDGTPSLSVTQSFVVTVMETNSLPVLIVPADQVVVETRTLTVTNTASDGDLPAQTLTFALVSAPSGVNLNPTNGVLTWTPTEAQGPSTNTITLRVFDDGTPSLSVTQSFVVTVTESNSAPTLTVPGSRTITELSTLTVTNTATDSDIPAQTLSFALVSAPIGVNLNPTNGVLTWTPTEAQGPSTNTITLRVSDNGTPSLSVTQSFVVTVTESNTAPVLDLVNDQFVNEATLLTLTLTAADFDLPVQSLIFALDPGAPAGASLGETNGVFTWTPPIGHQPMTNVITVRVSDNGQPSMSATRTFRVIVVSAPQLGIEVSTAGVVTLRWPTVAGRSYQVRFKDELTDANWTDLGAAITADGPVTSITDNSAGHAQRFYQIKLVD